MKFYSILLYTSILLSLTSCHRWDETVTTARLTSRKTKSLFGLDEDSKAVEHASDFYGDSEEEFVALQDQDLYHYGSKNFRQISESEFQKPTGKRASLFSALHFQTDSHQLQQSSALQAVQKIGAYLKSHPEVHLRIEGHCDERGSEAYNLALGTRRANTVRDHLLKHGAKSHQLHTVSYGKERPVQKGHTKEAWAKNRRVEFQLHEPSGNR